MRLSEFKNAIKRNWIKLEWMTDKANMEEAPNPKNRRGKVLKDKRTYQRAYVYYIYPFAHSEDHIYIACPYCGEIHAHDYSHGDFEGHKVPLCRNKNVKKYNIIKGEKQW